MVNFLDGFSGAVRGAYCNMLQNGDTFVRYSQEFYRSLGLPVDLTYNGFRPLYLAYCSSNPPEQPAPAFPAGQCPVRYGVEFSWTERYTDDSTNNRTSARPCSEGGGGFYGEFGEPYIQTQFGFQSYAVNCRDADGNPQVLTLSDQYGPSSGVSLENPDLTLTRCDGLTDNCGESQYPDPPDNYNDIDVNFDVDIDGIETTINGNIVFNIPILIAGNNVVIPLTFTYVDVNLDVPITLRADLNLSIGEVNFTFGGDKGYRDHDPRKQPCKNDDYPEPVDENDRDEDEPEPEDMQQEESIIGVLVTVQNVEDGTTVGTLFQDDNLDVALPDFGLVSFRVRVGRTTTGWTPDQRVKNRRCVIECPWVNGALEVRGTAREGVTWVLSPIRAVNSNGVSIV